MEKWTKKMTYTQLVKTIKKADEEGIPGVVACGKVVEPMQTFHDENWRRRDVLSRVDLHDGSYTVLSNQGIHATETSPRIKWVDTE